MKKGFLKSKNVLGIILSFSLLLSNIIGVTTAYADTGSVQPLSTSKVTFGVMSDNHVTASKTVEQDRLAKAFQFFGSQNTDAVAVVGDLTDSGSQSDYDTWSAIMKANKGNMQLVASMGNHEGNSASKFTAATDDKPNANYIINGYHFITLSPGTGTFDPTTGKGTSQGGSDYSYVVDWLKAQLKEAVNEDPNKPIFVFFHHPLRNTFYVSDEWYGTGLSTGKDDSFQSVFSGFPQVVCFSGHIHSPNNNPKSIWQDGGFTAVNTVTTSYTEMESGMVGGTKPADASQVAQGMVIEAEGSKVTIRNYDLISNQFIPQTWQFDVSKPAEFPYTKARDAVAKAPVFPQNAAVRLSNINDNGATLDFDQAVMESNTIGDIVHSYRYDIVNKKTGEVEKSFKNWSEYYRLPMPTTITQKVEGLNPGTEYEARIYAIDAYGKVSEQYISSDFKTTGTALVALDDLGFEDFSKAIPAADLLDVDFTNGTVSDASPANHVFSTVAGANITMDSTLGKNVAEFTQKTSEGYSTPWTSTQYSQINDGFTIESVFKVNSFSNYVDFFGNMQSAGLGFELSEGSVSGKANLEFWVNIGGYKVPKAADAIEIGKWYHAVGVYDGKQVMLYLNGKMVASVAASGTVKTPATASQKYVIGGDINSTGGIEAPFTGSISLARIYSEPLSYIDIYRLANRELSSNDDKKPMIELAAQPANVGMVGKKYIVPSFMAVDNSGVVNTQIQVLDQAGNSVQVTEESNGTGYSFVPTTNGLYTINYIATDKAGNITKDSHNVNVAPDVEGMIEALPISILLSDKSAVENARNSYNQLNEDQKQLVTNYEKLVAAENKIADLEKATSDLDAAIKAAEDYAGTVKVGQHAGEYSQQDYDNFEKMLATATEYSKTLTALDQINQYTNTINKAMEDFKAKAINFSALKNEIQTATNLLNKYVKVSNLGQYKKFNKAISDAAAVLNNNPIKRDVDAALATLKKAETDFSNSVQHQHKWYSDKYKDIKSKFYNFIERFCIRYK